MKYGKSFLRSHRIVVINCVYMAFQSAPFKSMSEETTFSVRNFSVSSQSKHSFRQKSLPPLSGVVYLEHKGSSGDCPCHRTLPKSDAEQISLFDNVQQRIAKEKVQDAVEEIRSRFGKAAVTYASLLGDLKMPTDGRDKVKMPGIMYQ